MSDLISKKLILVHANGANLYPVRMKDRDTGRVAFRLSKRGNTKKDSIEVVDELEMIRKVTKENYMVRARTVKPVSQGGSVGLYRLQERSIRKHYVNIA
jgi:hypothetical protein